MLNIMQFEMLYDGVSLRLGNRTGILLIQLSVLCLGTFLWMSQIGILLEFHHQMK